MQVPLVAHPETHLLTLCPLPPQLPVRNCLPVDPERGKVVATSNHRQAGTTTLQSLHASYWKLMWRPSCLYRSCSVSRTCSTRRMRMIPLSSRRTRPSSTRDQICPLPLQRLTDLFLDLTCNLQERQGGLREARQAAGEGVHSEVNGVSTMLSNPRIRMLYLGCTRKAPRTPGLCSLSSILSLHVVQSAELSTA